MTLCQHLLHQQGKNVIPPPPHRLRQSLKIDFTISFIVCFWICRQSTVSVVSCSNTPMFWIEPWRPVLLYFLPAVIVIIILKREHVKCSAVTILFEQFWPKANSPNIPIETLWHGSCLTINAKIELKHVWFIGRDNLPRVKFHKDYYFFNQWNSLWTLNVYNFIFHFTEKLQ